MGTGFELSLVFMMAKVLTRVGVFIALGGAFIIMISISVEFTRSKDSLDPGTFCSLFS